MNKANAVKRKTKKTSKRKRADTVKVPEEFMDENGVLNLGPLLPDYQAVDLQMTAARAVFKSSKLEIELWQERNPEYKRLAQMQLEAQHYLTRAGIAYNLLIKKAGEQIGVSLKRCAIDDNTGKITVIAKDNSLKPATVASVTEAMKGDEDE